MIILIRHGEAENSRGRAIGHTDLALSPTGEMQARILAEALTGIKFASLYASPLKRTAKTAQQIAVQCGLVAEYDSRLMEIKLGEWDGRFFDDLKAEYPEEYRERGENIAQFRPPGGENFLDLKNRAADFLSSIEDRDGPMLLVTHAGVIRIMIHIVLNFPIDKIFNIRPDHCNISIITKSKSGYNLKAFNVPPSPELKTFLNKSMP